ncbi:hypothetical protein NDA12_002278 [Ustilago hordei]|nr:hypothetical protein NDA12_002278 [Ustilago hordei]
MTTGLIDLDWHTLHPEAVPVEALHRSCALQRSISTARVGNSHAVVDESHVKATSIVSPTSSPAAANSATSTTTYT